MNNQEDLLLLRTLVESFCTDVETSELSRGSGFGQHPFTDMYPPSARIELVRWARRFRDALGEGTIGT